MSFKILIMNFLFPQNFKKKGFLKMVENMINSIKIDLIKIMIDPIKKIIRMMLMITILEEKEKKL